jgi:hypothetical protein
MQEGLVERKTLRGRKPDCSTAQPMRRPVETCRLRDQGSTTNRSHSRRRSTIRGIAVIATWPRGRLANSAPHLTPPVRAHTAGVVATLPLRPHSFCGRVGATCVDPALWHARPVDRAMNDLAPDARFSRRGPDSGVPGPPQSDSPSSQRATSPAVTFAWRLPLRPAEGPPATRSQSSPAAPG